MASLKNIKVKILSYKKTGTVTKAMQAVSAVKMRKTQERALGGRAYAATALSILERISGSVDTARHPLMSERGHAAGAAKTCFVVITSDKGLAGSLNSAVIRAVENEIAGTGLSQDAIVMIAIGRRGGEYFARRGYDVRVKHENVSDDVPEVEMQEVTRAILAWHKAGEISACRVVYTNFISTFEQEAVSRQIVPVTPTMVKEMVEGIRPARGKYAPSQASHQSVRAIAYTMEPNSDSILSVLLPRLLGVAVFHALLESKASEHSARMVAMKSATDKSKEMVIAMTRTFNRVRQAAITREVSEITSGIEAMK